MKKTNPAENMVLNKDEFKIYFLGIDNNQENDSKGEPV
jgi:hypothetical protein